MKQSQYFCLISLGIKISGDVTHHTFSQVVSAMFMLRSLIYIYEEYLAEKKGPQ